MSGSELTRPSGKLRKVSGSDTVDLPDGPCRGLLVGTAGNARIIDASGFDVTASNLVPLQAGYNPIQVLRIYSTGLTASNIWALY